MAEGEFALVKDHLAAAGSKPVVMRGGLVVNDNILYFMWADLAVLRRDEAGLRQYAPLAEDMARRDGHILFQASAHRAWGVLHRLTGDYVEAEARLNQALGLFQELETRWQIGRTLFELAELAVARTDSTVARDCFSRALEIFEAIRANPDAVRIREALRSLD